MGVGEGYDFSRPRVYGVCGLLRRGGFVHHDDPSDLI
jgi:hypothetical protein